MEDSDFLPERIRTQRDRRRRLTRQGYLLLVFALALAGLGYVRQFRLESARGDLATVSDRQSGIHQQLETRSDLEKRLSELVIKKRVEEQLGSRISAPMVLAELQNQSPPAVVLTNLEFETMEVSLPGKPVTWAAGSRTSDAPANGREVTVKRVQLLITGLAPSDVDVANFIGHLSASPLFEDVNMGYAKNVVVRGRIAREFQASCFVAR